MGISGFKESYTLTYAGKSSHQVLSDTSKVAPISKPGSNYIGPATFCKNNQKTSSSVKIINLFTSSVLKFVRCMCEIPTLSGLYVEVGPKFRHSSVQ